MGISQIQNGDSDLNISSFNSFYSPFSPLFLLELEFLAIHHSCSFKGFLPLVKMCVYMCVRDFERTHVLIYIYICVSSYILRLSRP